jgi:hypothetical protein
MNRAAAVFHLYPPMGDAAAFLVEEKTAHQKKEKEFSK